MSKNQNGNVTMKSRLKQKTTLPTKTYKKKIIERDKNLSAGYLSQVNKKNTFGTKLSLENFFKKKRKIKEEIFCIYSGYARNFFNFF